jgi:hypothetical protein
MRGMRGIRRGTNGCMTNQSNLNKEKPGKKNLLPFAANLKTFT